MRRGVADVKRTGARGREQPLVSGHGMHFSTACAKAHRDPTEIPGPRRPRRGRRARASTPQPASEGKCKPVVVRSTWLANTNGVRLAEPTVGLTPYGTTTVSTLETTPAAWQYKPTAKHPPCSWSVVNTFASRLRYPDATSNGGGGRERGFVCGGTPERSRCLIPHLVEFGAGAPWLHVQRVRFKRSLHVHGYT